MKTAIIGLGSAGYAALMAIKKRNPKAEVIIIDPKKCDLMHPCGLPYSLEGIVKEDDLEQDINLKRMGVTKIKALAESINPSAKKVSVQKGNECIEIPYDTAIIAAGNTPIIPPIKGIDKALNNSLYTLTNLEDLSRIKAALNKGRTGIVIGAGAIGLETAISLKKHLDKVIIVEMTDQVLPGILDRDISGIVEEYLDEMGIELYLNSRVDEITGDGQLSCVIASGELIKADIGILATGFRASTDIAVNSSIECDNNGIVVDDHLRTSMNNVYAAGDCISAWSVIDKKGGSVMLATSAYKQGTVAGINAAGGEEKYNGSAGTFVTKIGDLEVAGTGYTEKTARINGYDPVSGKIKSYLLPEYFPGSSTISIKVVVDKISGMILGAQTIGKEGAAERINLVSMAIEFNIPLRDFARVELAYCPAVSEVNDPILRAIDFAIRRIK